MDWKEINFDAQLCYVEERWAYFSTKPPNEMWGDDWNDAPYEHNAGTPYGPCIHYKTGGVEEKDLRDWNEDGTPKWQVYRVAWDGDFELPSEGLSNSPFTVEQINNGVIAWMRSSKYRSGDMVIIPAGTTLAMFITKVTSIGGEVFLPVAMP